MAKRYALTPVIGNGTRENPYRSALSDIPGVNVVQAIDPARPVCLVKFAASNVAAVLATADVFGMPDFPLDGKLTAMQNQTRNAMRSALTSRGFDGGLVDGSDGYRDLIRGVGRSLKDVFHEDSFEPSEVI